MFNRQRFQACEYSNRDWLMDAECVLITIYPDRCGKYVVGRRHSSSTDNSCHSSTWYFCCPCHILGRSEAQFPPFFSSSIGKTRPRGVSFAVPFSGDIAWRPRNPFSLPFERLPRRLLAISSTIDFILLHKEWTGGFKPIRNEEINWMNSNWQLLDEAYYNMKNYALPRPITASEIWIILNIIQKLHPMIGLFNYSFKIFLTSKCAYLDLCKVLIFLNLPVTRQFH